MTKTILAIAANPDGTSMLRLDREIRDIRSFLQQAKYRDEFDLKDRTAARWEDLHRAILEVKPRIVHFCGHGTGEAGLLLERDCGQQFVISTDVLSALFKTQSVSNTVECVVLNACYSATQAKTIAQHINYVIGMNRAIPDKDAIAYAKGFYLALGARLSIPEAHEQGLVFMKTGWSGNGSRRDAELPIETETNNALIPEIYIKEKLTSFPDPFGQPYHSKSNTQDVHEGFVALVDLLSNPEIYALVSVFRRDFKLISEQIQLLNYYKALHDLLHTLEIQYYRNIVQEARRFPDDGSALQSLTLYNMGLQDILQEARRAVAAHPATTSDPSWLSQLDDASQALQTAVDNLDTRPLKKAISLLTRLLAHQPVCLNTSLTETAKALRLSALVTSLVTLKGKIEAIATDSAKVQQFTEGIAALSDLSVQLEQRVQTHNAWQEVDSVLRLIETSLNGDTSNLEWWWPDLKEKTQLLYLQEIEILTLQQWEQKLDDAIAATDPVKIESHFCTYRRAALLYFFQVDRSLIQLCGELQTISQSIALVVEKIS